MREPKELSYLKIKLLLHVFLREKMCCQSKNSELDMVKESRTFQGFYGIN